MCEGDEIMAKFIVLNDKDNYLYLIDDEKGTEENITDQGKECLYCRNSGTGECITESDYMAFCDWFKEKEDLSSK